MPTSWSSASANLKLERGRIGLMEIDPRHERLPAGQPIQRAARKPARRRDRVHQGLVARAARRSTAPKSSTACARPACCASAPWRRWSRAARPGREGIRAARRRRRRHPRRRRRHRFPHHRLDADGEPGDVLRQSAALRRACCNKATSSIMELAAGYRGYTAQIGSPICVGEPTEMVKKFWNEITLPGYRRIVAEIAPGKPVGGDAAWRADSSATTATSRARRNATASTSSPTSRTSFAEHVARGEIRESAQARHGDHGRAQPDHAGRTVRDFPRPYLHRDRRPATRWSTISRWRSRWRGGETTFASPVPGEAFRAPQARG